MNEATAREKYSNRHEEVVTVTRNDATGFHTKHWSWGGHKALTGIRPGQQLVIETVLGSRVVGARLPGADTWLFRKTTDELVREHEEMLEGFRRREREQLDANRNEWQRREDALPAWLRDRLKGFHQSGGENFELQGWGYELTICEIAILLLENDLDDDAPAVMAYASEHGTTGNQHGMAMALARAHRQQPAASMSGTVSALSPLTGNADYATDATP